MPPKITDKYRLRLLYTHKDIPPFAASIADFVEMWDGADYSYGSDRRNVCVTKYEPRLALARVNRGCTRMYQTSNCNCMTAVRTFDNISFRKQ
jgi:hypothetical protein